MKQWLSYIKTEEKRALKLLPAVFAEAALFMLLLAAALFVCSRLFGKNVIQKAAVGIVREEDNRVTDMALSYLEGMAGAKEMCAFAEMTLEEGSRALLAGEIAAMIVLPDGVVESVLEGSNLPVSVYLPKENSFGTLYLTALAQAGGSMLSKAQAQIYAVHDLAVQTKQTEKLSEFERDINLYNLHFAVNRDRIIEKKELVITGKLPVWKHYLSAGVIFILFLTGTVCGSFLKGDNEALRGQLYRNGVGAAAQVTGRLFGVCTVIAAIAVCFVGLIPLGDSIFAFLSSVFCISSMLVFCYEAASDRSAGMVCVVAGAVILLFLSGGLVPEVFLPKAFRQMGDFLPVKSMIQGSTGLPALYGGLLYVGAVLISYKKGVRG